MHSSFVVNNLENMFFKTRKTQIFTFVAHGVLPIFLCLAICHINFFHDIQSFSCLLSVVTFCSVWVQTVRTTGATPDVQTNCTKKIAIFLIWWRHKLTWKTSTTPALLFIQSSRHPISFSKERDEGIVVVVSVVTQHQEDCHRRHGKGPRSTRP